MEKISYAGYRFPPEIIDQAIWLYLRFTLSLRDVEDLLAERGVAVSYETVRRWANHFGPMIAADGLVTATVARLGSPGKMAHDDLVRAPPVSACDHPARGLAICAFHAQLSRRRR